MLIVAGLIGFVFMGFGLYWLYSLIRSRFDKNYIPILKPWMTFLITVVAFICSGVVANQSPELISDVSTSNNAVSVSQTLNETKSKITMEKFKQLQSGMSYQQVVDILGREGEELSRSDLAGYTTVMYQWTEGFSNMNAMFQNNSLVSKAQFGLK
jgi:hypothetical protein